MIKNELAKVLEERNQIEREKNSNRDRVDISLKQYNEMQEKIDDLENKLWNVKQTLNKILEPFKTANLPEEILEDILVNHNFEKCEIKAIDDPLQSKIAIIYTVNNYRR